MANGDDIGKAAGAELAAMGGAPAPQKAGGFNIGSFLGEVVKHAGLFAASAAIPGFGEGYVSGLAQREAQAAQERQNLENLLLRDPDRILQFPELQKRAKNIFGNDITQQFVQAAEERRGFAQAAQLMQQFAGTQGPGAFVPAVGGEQTQALFTPTGQVIQAGQVGAQPIQARGALARGTVQETLRFTPQGTTRELAPTPTSELERRGRVGLTQGIATLQRSFEAMGNDPVTARTKAVQEAASQGHDISQLAPEDRALLELAPPGGTAQGPAARRAGQITGAEAQARAANVPLSRADLALLIDPETGERAPLGTTANSAAEQGFVSVSSADLEDEKAVKAALTSLGEFQALSEGLFKGVTGGPLGAFARANQAKLVAQANTDPESAAAQFQSFLGAGTELIRALGQRGNLTEEEQKRGFSLISGFSFFETERSAKKKMDRLQKLFDLALKRTRVPQPPTGADDPQIQQLLQQLPPGTKLISVK